MKKTIEKFYTAFTNLDAASMSECYHPEIVFEDPAFGKLQGERAKKMWRMLCDSQKGKNFNVVFSEATYENGKGTAKWDAYYTFSQTGRKIHNKVFATFAFANDLIIRHQDDFDLYQWAKQALGFKGLLLGKTTFFKARLQRTTNSMLDAFEK